METIQVKLKKQKQEVMLPEEIFEDKKIYLWEKFKKSRKH